MAEDKRNRPDQPPSGNQGPDRDRSKTVNPAAPSLPAPAALARKTRKSPRNSTSRAHGRRRPPPVVPRASETRATPRAPALCRRVLAKRSQVSASNRGRSTRPRATTSAASNDCANAVTKFATPRGAPPPASVSKTTHAAKTVERTRVASARRLGTLGRGTDFAFIAFAGAFPAVKPRTTTKEKCGHADL